MSSDHDGVIDETVERLHLLAPSGRPFPIREPLVADECRWFGRAIDEGVVTFRECPDDCFRYKKWKVKGPDHFETPSGKPRHLFSKPDAPEAWLNREYVPHIAAYARAVLDIGYEQSDSSFSLYRTYSRDLISKQAGKTYETDAEFYAPDGRIHLQVEAKAQPDQVAKIVRQLDEAASLSELPANTVKEIEYVLDLRPRYLWIVGPGSVDLAKHVYAVEVDDLNATFEALPQLPPPPT